MQIQVKHLLEDVEVLPGVVWTLSGVNMTVEINDSGAIREITVHGVRKTYLHARCQYPELWAGLTAAIARQYRDEIETYARLARATHGPDDWLMGRFMNVA